MAKTQQKPSATKAKAEAPATETKAEAPATEASGAASATSGLDRLVDVELRLTVEIGGTRLPLRDVLQLGKGSVVELDRERSDPADMFLNGRRIGRGEVTTLDDRLAVRIVELFEPETGSR